MHKKKITNKNKKIKYCLSSLVDILSGLHAFRYTKMSKGGSQGLVQTLSTWPHFAEVSIPHMIPCMTGYRPIAACKNTKKLKQ